MSYAEKTRPCWTRFTPPLEWVGHALKIGLPVGALAGIVAFGNWESLSDGDGNGRDSQSYIASLAPDKRFQHDFNGFKESGDDCLGDTGYDLYDSGHNQIIKVGAISMDGDVIAITPGEPNEYGDELRLKNDADQPDAGSKPLQPADEVSRWILDVNGCDFGKY